ncbi:gfo/Idh/MocA family oxidoreductase [Halobacillus litoralis]|uniref:Gfo/Idh/MocA family oxidoreductase n=1 Tax=Halobacillus litoralis TaxID=45668 RepID=A0A845F6K3_9BACI|nr:MULTISPECIES: Gfo/Idh/MocA family oxidoreductase [Halobacillus]MEC3884147.1 Gfo/Idh/MocA family oxidoreductase [Halobacillus sp. HZG1]MYL69743.1 gfo/Idh/MocA family oxidoreductase [Halobacillus litoralis]
MTQLKIAIIGCGSIAQNRHLPEYEANKNVEVKAVCDIVEERAREVAQVQGATLYTDYEELLKNEEVDAVSVCLPNYLHAPVSIAALNAGAHVLCEKPMATTKEEAEEMIQAAEKNGKKLMIAHNQRFVPSHVKAKELIESGAIGKVYSFRTAFGHGGPEGWSAEGEDSWFFKKDQAFIGAMGDLGVHKADLLRYILGEEFVDVAGFVENNAKKDITVDDNAVCILRSQSGVVGTMAASWAYNPNEDNSTVIYGEKGTLRLEDDPEYSLIAQYTNGDIVNYQLGKIQSNEEGGQSNSHVIDHFVDSILNDTEPLITGEEGMKSLEVILGALRSGETRQISSLEKVTK